MESLVLTGQPFIGFRNSASSYLQKVIFRKHGNQGFDRVLVLEMCKSL